VTAVAGSSGVLDEVVGDDARRPVGPPAAGEMAAILKEAVRRHAGPPMKIRRHESDEGPAFWRWDCSRCGEYGGGRHHPDAMTRALRHCAEHPGHRSSLLPPMRCAEDREPPAPVVHPMLFAVDDDPPPAPLAI
jgi:hypothetical protein